ncbi:MAG TPA: hypothetical protein VFF28_07720 [Candidatus Nanoarchaeia archaeon]|nr:hypothetical protein [Candidatus Nanoarchaeia archaeon]
MQGAIPRCVDELFAEGIKTYLNAARCHKDSHEGNLWKTLEYPKDIQSIFYEMAFNLYSRGSRSMSVEDICSSEKWNDIYKNTKSSVKQPFTKEERKALIRELALTSPFFGYSNIQDGQYPYQFTNLAVQEYMAGRELIRAIERLNTDRKQITVDYIAEAIIKITDHDPLWWRQPLICACSDTDLGTHVMAFLLKTGIEDLIADAYFFGKHNPLDPKVSDQFQGAYEKKYGPKKPTQ